MQVLFVWDSAGELDRAAAEQCLRDVTSDPAVQSEAMAMATGAWEQRQIIDARVERLGPQWPPRRQPAVDRNLIRLAVWEMTNRDTPPKVVLDEAIELAKIFSTENSASFVNGLLDAVFQENRALTDDTSAAERAAAADPQPQPSP